jgi:hypothetical protein
MTPLLALLAVTALATGAAPDEGDRAAVAPAAAEAPAVTVRDTTVIFRPLGLIPAENDGTRAWHVEVAVERRVAGPTSFLVEGGFSPQERAGLSFLLFDARLQARWYVLGDLDGGWDLAAEVEGVTHGGATGVPGASGVELTALAGWKRAFASGFTLDWQFGAGDIVAQSTPGAFQRAVIVGRLGLGWTF